jgi:hypothetical protein
LSQGTSDRCLRRRRFSQVFRSSTERFLSTPETAQDRTFFDDPDDAIDRRSLADNCRVAGGEVWAWCLMPNHVHLISCRPTRPAAPRAGARAPLCRRHPDPARTHKRFPAGHVRRGCHGRGSACGGAAPCLAEGRAATPSPALLRSSPIASERSSWASRVGYRDPPSSRQFCLANERGVGGS